MIDQHSPPSMHFAKRAREKHTFFHSFESFNCIASIFPCLMHPHIAIQQSSDLYILHWEIKHPIALHEIQVYCSSNKLFLFLSLNYHIEKRI